MGSSTCNWEVGQTPEWWPHSWKGKTVAIVASGPTAATAGVEQLRGRMPVVAINQSFELTPWADILYGCDGKWWRYHNFVPDFRGLKLTFDAATAFEHPEIKKIEIATEVDTLLMERPAKIGCGGNSGFQMVNLCTQFGVSKILLIGFDMRIDIGSHWHGRHPPGLNNPCERQNLPRWRRAMEGAAMMLPLLGVEAINCSPVSALNNFPKMSLKDALNVGTDQNLHRHECE